MVTRNALFVSAITVALFGAGCATVDAVTAEDVLPARAPIRVEHGTVEAIQIYRSGDNQLINVGTLLGGIAGGVIGHQIGSGSGNTVATIGGAIAGGVVGHEIEKKRVEGSRYRITVHLESGATLSVENAKDLNLRVGDRVRVENGRIYRE